MSRFRGILEGKDIADVTTIGSYTYYLYVSTKDELTWVVMRENSAGDEFRFSTGIGNATSEWADPTALVYVRRNELNV